MKPIAVWFFLLFAGLFANHSVIAEQVDQEISQRVETSNPVEQAEPELPTSSSSGNLLPATDGQWRYSIAFPMLWAPEINGKIRGDERFDFNIAFKDILKNLSFGLMFELYANRGPYGLVYRSNFMRVKDENTRSGLLETRVKTQLNMGVNDLLASFRVHDKVRLVAGVRHVHAKMDLKVRSTISSQDGQQKDQNNRQRYV